MPAPPPDSEFPVLVRALADADWTAAPGVAPEAVAAALPALRGHGVLAGIARRLERTALWPRLDDATRRALAEAASAGVARELASRAALDGALAALARAGIAVLVVKGEALARDVYPLPGVRERGDVDAWVAADDFVGAERVLAGCGFARRPAASGEWLQPEATWMRDDAQGRVAIDLHRRLFAQPSLAAVLPFDDVLARSLPFGDSARMPGRADALLVAALHRVAHHADEERALWWWDVHLLCTRDPDAASAAAAIARARGASAILGDAFAHTAATFGTRFPPGFVAGLLACAPREPSARLLRPMSASARWWYDLRTLPDARARRRWIAETLFPSRAYMRARFGDAPLAWLYAKRAARGAWRAVFPPRK